MPKAGHPGDRPTKKYDLIRADNWMIRKTATVRDGRTLQTATT